MVFSLVGFGLTFSQDLNKKVGKIQCLLFISVELYWRVHLDLWRSLYLDWQWILCRMGTCRGQHDWSGCHWK